MCSIQNSVPPAPLLCLDFMVIEMGLILALLGPLENHGMGQGQGQEALVRSSISAYGQKYRPHSLQELPLKTLLIHSVSKETLG